MPGNNFIRHVSDDDIEAAQRVAGRLLGPEPRRRNDRKPHLGVSYEEVAQVLGVSRQRVQQLERRALEKCRLYLERHYPGLTVDDLLRRR